MKLFGAQISDHMYEKKRDRVVAILLTVVIAIPAGLFAGHTACKILGGKEWMFNFVASFTAFIVGVLIYACLSFGASADEDKTIRRR